MGLRNLFVSALAAASTLITATSAAEIVSRGSLQKVASFNSKNTSGTKMYVYVPNALKANPAVVVAIHYCTGTASGYYSGSPYHTLAEQYNFIVIYPESPYSGTCWDVSSTAALTHNGGADSNSIADMVTYILAQYTADATRVFVTGSSSGAMMTNVLAATYPEMFAAATVYSGVAAGCFYTGTTDGWNSTCAQGNSIHTQAQWAQTALNMYPGYTGTRPKMLIFHGSADTTLYPPNFQETIKQWTGVFGYSATPLTTQSGVPSSVYTKTTYGPNVVGIYGQGVGHTVPIMGDQDMAWFGLSGASSAATTTTTKPTTPVTPPTETSSVLTSSALGTTLTTVSVPATTAAPVPVPDPTPSAPAVACAAMYGQCGGIGFSGATCCSAGTCQSSNSYYSQCL